MSIDLSNMKVVSGSASSDTANEAISNGDVLARVGTGVSKADNTDKTKTTVVGVAINNAPAGGLVFYLGTGSVIEDDNISNAGYDVTYWLGSSGNLVTYGEGTRRLGRPCRRCFPIQATSPPVDFKLSATETERTSCRREPSRSCSESRVDSVDTDSISISWSAPVQSSQPVTRTTHPRRTPTPPSLLSRNWVDTFVELIDRSGFDVSDPRSCGVVEWGRRVVDNISRHRTRRRDRDPGDDSGSGGSS